MTSPFSSLSRDEHDDNDHPHGIGRTGDPGSSSRVAGPGVDSIDRTLRACRRPASVGKVRREVVADLQTRDIPEQLVDEAEIVASELLTECRATPVRCPTARSRALEDPPTSSRSR